MSILDLKESIERNEEFHICWYGNMFYSYHSVLKLDEEDIEYFKKKYYPKLNDELAKELEKVIKKYN